MFILHKFRHRFHHKVIFHRVGFLFSGFREDKYYWEVRRLQFFFFFLLLLRRGDPDCALWLVLLTLLPLFKPRQQLQLPSMRCPA